MDEKRYRELVLDPTRWVKVARRLRGAAELLAHVERAEALGYLAHPSIDDAVCSWERMVAGSSGCGVLLAYAVENACKAREVRLGRATVKGGRIKGLTSKHDLVEMVRRLSVPLTGAEEVTLRRLTWQVLFIGRYPVAKSLDQQNEFLGVAEGASACACVDAVIVRTLADPDLVDLYVNPAPDTVRDIATHPRGPAIAGAIRVAAEQLTRPPQPPDLEAGNDEGDEAG